MARKTNSNFDEYKAERDFAKQHPKPEQPKLPPPALTGVPVLVRHKTGGLWFQPDEANDHFGLRRGDASAPHVKLTIAHDKEVDVLILDLDAFEVIERALAEAKQDLQKIWDRRDAIRKAEAAYEDATVNWEKAQAEHVKQKRKEFSEAQKADES
ncbi:MAG: hypothetical protein K8I82_06165 [Anaerolineae bacterium]|nr:hypothetical protein [Anaerolineae bacterium]